LSGCSINETINEGLSVVDKCNYGLNNINKLEDIRMNFESAMAINDFDNAEKFYYEFIEKARETNRALSLCTYEDFTQEQREGLLEWENTVVENMVNRLKLVKTIEEVAKIGVSIS
jgi:hypothetical protein